MFRLLASLTLLAAMAGCERTITAQDVFLPDRAPSLILSVSDERGLLIDRNQPREGLFEAAGISFEDGRLETSVGEVAWRLARQGDPDKPLIVNCHGNAGDIENHGNLTVWKLHPHGDVMVWDYPGYGASDGHARVSDFEAVAADLAVSLPGFRRDETQKVVFWGYSFGGFICARLAAQSGLADAVVFEASALSAEMAVKAFVPAYASLFVRPRLSDDLRGYDNAAALRGVDAPVLVLSGLKDRVLPPRQSRRLRDGLIAAGLDVDFGAFETANHFTIAFSDGFDEQVEVFLSEAGVLAPD
ncbi:MAG: alpha/beta fold hydrolase [Pseudomonadota bacterium]